MWPSAFSPKFRGDFILDLGAIHFQLQGAVPYVSLETKERRALIVDAVGAHNSGHDELPVHAFWRFEYRNRRLEMTNVCLVHETQLGRVTDLLVAFRVVSAQHAGHLHDGVFFPRAVEGLADLEADEELAGVFQWIRAGVIDARPHRRDIRVGTKRVYGQNFGFHLFAILLLRLETRQWKDQAMAPANNMTMPVRRGVDERSMFSILAKP